MTYPGFEFHRLNGFVPRVSVVYDMFGTGRTALKLADRYSYNAGTMTNANSMMAGFVNPMARTSNATGGMARCRTCPTRPISSRHRAAPIARWIGFELPTPTNSWSASISIHGDATLRFNYVRKLERNRMKLQNTAIPFEAYNIPVAFTDRGRDFASTADDRVLTLYSLERGYVGQRADVLMNDPLFTADYETYNVEVVKRLSGKSGADRLRHQPLRHLGLRVGDLAGHRHRHERVRRAAGSEPPDLQQPAGLLALAV